MFLCFENPWNGSFSQSHGQFSANELIDKPDLQDVFQFQFTLPILVA